MLTVIIPVHNEARILRRNILKLKTYLEASGYDYEIIIAEDGSTDGSLKAAQGLSGPRVRVLTSKKRLGRGISISRAIRDSKGEIAVYMDVDLASDLSSLPSLISEINRGSDISTGSRLLPTSQVNGRKYSREVASVAYNRLLRLLFGSRIRDHQCGFKAFRVSTIKKLLDSVGDPHWFWDSELLIRAQKAGLRVTEIPVIWTDRHQSSVRLPSDIVYMGLSALRLRLSI